MLSAFVQNSELAAAAQVTLVFPEDRVMERLFTPEIAAFYEKFYEDKCARWELIDAIRATLQLFSAW